MNRNEDLLATLALIGNARGNKEIERALSEEIKNRQFRKLKPYRVELARRDVVEFAKIMDEDYMSTDPFYKTQLLYLYQGAFQKRIREFIEVGKLDIDFLDGYLHLRKGEEVIGIKELIEKEEKEPDIGYLIINLPPRHGKSYLLQLFIAWLFGVDKEQRIMYAMYSLSIASDFSKNIRDRLHKPDIEELEGAELDRIILYHDIFPDVDILRGEDKQAKWTIEGGRQSFLATSPGGSSTGFGATLTIVDDLIKNATEAYNDKKLEDDHSWFNNTIASREEKGKYGSLKMIISTRWSKNDITGKIIQDQRNTKPEFITPILHLELPALMDREKGIMLAPNTLSYKDYLKRTSNMNEEIVEANYNQNIITVGDKIYTGVKIYDKGEFSRQNIPFEIISYIDIADTGKDYTAMVIAAMDEYNGKLYVLDVVYNQKDSAFNEEIIADKLYSYGISRAQIETNGMGAVVQRNINNILKDVYGILNRKVLLGKHQSKNKEARIYIYSKFVENNIIFPDNFRENKEMHNLLKEMLSYSKLGNNTYDDGTDAITGLAEFFIQLTGSGVMIDDMTFKEHDDDALMRNGEIIGYKGKITEKDVL